MSYIAAVHPCPSCQAPVANVARRCQHCGMDQPNVDQDGYNRMASAFAPVQETVKDVATKGGASRDDRMIKGGATHDGRMTKPESLSDRFSLKRFTSRFRPSSK